MRREDGEYGFQMHRGDEREGDNGQWPREQGRERVRTFFSYNGISSGTGETVREGVRTGRQLVWPEIFGD